MELRSTTLGARAVRLKSPLIGRPPTWEGYCLFGILVAAAALYTWMLEANDWANAYYAAAVQAGLHDPLAFFFGSADWGNSITVDKPPLSLWVMGLSARLFGLNTWAILLPQVAMTLGSTLLIYRLSRRGLSARAALISAGIFATTPITVLLARYNNPDPLMVLLMLSALYAGVRATESGQARLLFLAACLLALGFLAKQLQAFLVLPAIAAVFLLYAPKAWKTKLQTVTIAGLILVVSSIAWPLWVDLTPAASRPYVGGSATNRMMELTLGYNGLDRVLKQEADPWSVLLPAEMRSVETDAGFFRLFNPNYGQEIGWLLLPALIACVAITVQVLKGRYSQKCAVIAISSVIWMTSTFVILSFMGNSFHSYYTASLAAPLALCVGLGTEIFVNSKTSTYSRIGITATMIGSHIFSRAMWQSSDVYPEFIGASLFLLGLICAAVLAVPAPKPWIKQYAFWTSAICLAVGPFVCAVLTVASPQEGSNPLSGGVTKNEFTLSRFMAGIKNGSPAWGTGLAVGVTPAPELASYLRDTDAGCEWAAATYPGQTAARFQLEIKRPIMPLGGFAATDPSPTIRQFQDWVEAKRVCTLVVQPEQLKVPGNSPDLVAIHQWVEANYESEEIGGTLVYRLVP